VELEQRQLATPRKSATIAEEVYLKQSKSRFQKQIPFFQESVIPVKPVKPIRDADWLTGLIALMGY
jgi:hypothetical protein